MQEPKMFPGEKLAFHESEDRLLKITHMQVKAHGLMLDNIQMRLDKIYDALNEMNGHEPDPYLKILSAPEVVDEIKSRS